MMANIPSPFYLSSPGLHQRHCSNIHLNVPAVYQARHRGAAAIATAAAAPTTATPAAFSSSASSTVSPIQLDPEVKAKHKRPQGWTAPGPQPAAAAGEEGCEPDLLLRPGPNETLSYLTGDWRIFQLRNGHRWSMDDMVTAYVALQTVQQPPLQAVLQSPLQAVQPPAAAAAAAAAGSHLSRISHVLDLGCGIGSVLLMVAWGLRRMVMEQQQQQQQQLFPITSLGVEAQSISYQLAVRNVRYNLGDCGGQVQVLHQDLRQPLPPSVPQRFQLITGTPPYIPPGSGEQSIRPQKGPCCVEIRGGIEDYCQAAAAVLAPGGHFVVCCGLQGQPFKGRRAQLAAAAAGLVITRQVTVVTKQGKPPLFAVYVMQPAGDVLGTADAHAWVVRQQQQQQQQQTGSASSSSRRGSRDGGDSTLAAGQQADTHAGSSSSSSSEGVANMLAAQVAAGQLVGSEELFVVRAADGSHTPAWHAAREAMGLPPLQE